MRRPSPGNDTETRRFRVVVPQRTGWRGVENAVSAIHGGAFYVRFDVVYPSSRDRLCDALGARWDELTRAPEPADRALLLNRVPLKGDIAGSARTALTFVQLAYGLREEAIIDLAPLAFLILAERSLQARKAALDETVAALEAATEDARNRLPYLRGAFCDGYHYDWIDAERESLRNRYVYDRYVDEEGEPMSPFVDFLQKEIETLGLFKNSPMELQARYRDAPKSENMRTFGRYAARVCYRQYR